jgi:hypothetical protein
MKKLLCVVVCVLIGYSMGIAQVVSRDLVVKYDFLATSGTVIVDRMGGSNPLNLEITEPTKVTWLDPGLRVSEPTVVKTDVPRTKLDQAKFFANGITIEAWIKPLNNTQGGPARIITFSVDSGNRNFTFGQSGNYYNQRFRTSVNPSNGTSPSTSTPANSIAAAPVLQHVVYTRDPSGNAKFYINKVEVGSETVPGDGSNWDMTYGFGLFNEISFPTDDRTWLGDIFLVAIYSTVLTGSEIAQNFDAGPPTAPTGGPTVTLGWDPNTEPDLADYKIYHGTVSGDYVQPWVLSEERDNQNPACPEPYDPFNQACCEFTVKNLVHGETYYFVATAMDADKNESAYSEELIHVVSVVNTTMGEVKKMRRKVVP